MSAPPTNDKGIPRWQWGIFSAVCFAVVVNLVLASLGIAP